ncbi:hypothetical protein CDD83_3431 [Cordyceps sp. RAO-2017]|nr:hypothetical protein CDD83_3431 [Cordyceps sp. RAO-2017]
MIGSPSASRGRSTSEEQKRTGLSSPLFRVNKANRAVAYHERGKDKRPRMGQTRHKAAVPDKEPNCSLPFSPVGLITTMHSSGPAGPPNVVNHVRHLIPLRSSGRFSSAAWAIPRPKMAHTKRTDNLRPYIHTYIYTYRGTAIWSALQGGLRGPAMSAANPTGAMVDTPRCAVDPGAGTRRK